MRKPHNIVTTRKSKFQRPYIYSGTMTRKQYKDETRVNNKLFGTYAVIDICNASIMSFGPVKKGFYPKTKLFFIYCIYIYNMYHTFFKEPRASRWYSEMFIGLKQNSSELESTRAKASFALPTAVNTTAKKKHKKKRLNSIDVIMNDNSDVKDKFIYNELPSNVFE